MLTVEGKNVIPESPLMEYPTPQFARDSYLSLNGVWDFSIDGQAESHSYYDRKIVVPFAVESPLSRVGVRIKKGDVLHYRKTFRIPSAFGKGRVLLHFEAVDQICDVYLNGSKIAHHEGGYQPFTVDLIELVRGENVLCVDVTDDTDSPIFPRGKQRNKRGGIWYTPTSGIWGSVWLESVPNEVIQRLEITPQFDDKNVQIRAIFEGKIKKSLISVSYLGREVGKAEFDESGCATISLEDAFFPWSPESPRLYDLEVQINEDKVRSYFAMRKFGVVEWNGFKAFGLNNKPYFLNGLLDQGYWPDGGLTPPSDKAMADDILAAKSLGYNTLRKHIKIEPMRWYYHCDRLGMIVIQDMVNGGSPYKFRYIALRPLFGFAVSDEAPYQKLGRSSSRGRELFLEETKATVQRLYNCPCIAIWTLFNEGWGQFDAAKNTELLASLDHTRLIDSTSGWFDKGAGDFSSHHVYFKKVKLHNDGSRVLSLSEFGGYSLFVEMHTYSSKAFGYKKTKSEADLLKKLKSLYLEQVEPLIAKEGLSVAILTQLTDVEDEINGLLTYDRKKVKVSVMEMEKINAEMKFK